MLKIIYLAIIIFSGILTSCDTINNRNYQLDEKGNKIECERWAEPKNGDRILNNYTISKPKREIVTEKPKKENIMSFEIPILPKLH